MKIAPNRLKLDTIYKFIELPLFVYDSLMLYALSIHLSSLFQLNL